MSEEKRRVRVIFIGASMAGKTTLTQAMFKEQLRYHKTQTLDVVGGMVIDTPGEYLERGRLRGNLAVASSEADVVVLLQSATADISYFPPQFASMFSKPTVGVVTKADAAAPEQLKEAERRLQRAGVARIFVTSAYTGDGVQEFLDYIDAFDVKKGELRWAER